MKSIHIKECWPYEYVKPVRRVFKRETMDRANARKREQYLQRKLKSATVKTTEGKKLLKLPVYEMTGEFCDSLSRQWREDMKK